MRTELWKWTQGSKCANCWMHQCKSLINSIILFMNLIKKTHFRSYLPLPCQQIDCGGSKCAIVTSYLKRKQHDCWHVSISLWLKTHNCGIILSLVHLPSEVKATILQRTQVSSRFGRTECHSFKFIRWVVVEARFESPRNTGEQKKRKTALYNVWLTSLSSFPGSQTKLF